MALIIFVKTSKTSLPASLANSSAKLKATLENSKLAKTLASKQPLRFHCWLLQPRPPWPCLHQYLHRPFQPLQQIPLFPVLALRRRNNNRVQCIQDKKGTILDRIPRCLDYHRHRCQRLDSYWHWRIHQHLNSTLQLAPILTLFPESMSKNSTTPFQYQQWQRNFQPCQWHQFWLQLWSLFLFIAPTHQREKKKSQMIGCNHSSQQQCYHLRFQLQNLIW